MKRVIEDEKICPFKIESIPILTNVHCVGESCKWWREDDCVINIIADLLHDIRLDIN